MYEEFLYYWLLWIIFVIITFFMDKNKKRSYLMSWLLIVMICSPFEVSLHNIQISVAFCIMFIGSILFYTFESISFYKFIVTFTIMICYMSLLLWEKITPVWFFMSTYFIIAFITVLLISLFFQSLYEQVTIALVALGLGQLVFQFILISYHLHYVIGSEEFFIQICFIVLFQIVLNFAHVIYRQISRYFEQKFT